MSCGYLYSETIVEYAEHFSFTTFIFICAYVNISVLWYYQFEHVLASGSWWWRKCLLKLSTYFGFVKNMV